MATTQLENIKSTVKIPLKYGSDSGIYKIAGLFKENPEQVSVSKLKLKVEGDNFSNDNKDSDVLENIRGYNQQKLIDAHSDDVFRVEISPKEQGVENEELVQLFVKPEINILQEIYNLKNDQFNFTFVPTSNIREEDVPEMKTNIT
jgi:hypothetical protein